MLTEFCQHKNRNEILLKQGVTRAKYSITKKAFQLAPFMYGLSWPIPCLNQFGRLHTVDPSTTPELERRIFRPTYILFLILNISAHFKGCNREQVEKELLNLLPLFPSSNNFSFLCYFIKPFFFNQQLGTQQCMIVRCQNNSSCYGL